MLGGSSRHASQSCQTSPMARTHYCLRPDLRVPGCKLFVRLRRVFCYYGVSALLNRKLTCRPCSLQKVRQSRNWHRLSLTTQFWHHNISLAKAKQTQGACLIHLQRQLEVQHLYQVVTLRHVIHETCLIPAVLHMMGTSASRINSLLSLPACAHADVQIV